VRNDEEPIILQQENSKLKSTFGWNSWTSKQEMMKNQPHRNRTFRSEIYFLLKFMNNQTRNNEEPTTQEQDIS
jgi:hypothetical protein